MLSFGPSTGTADPFSAPGFGDMTKSDIKDSCLNKTESIK